MTIEEAKDELKPCPFCGGKAYVKVHFFHGLARSFGVQCYICGAQVRQFNSRPEEAIEVWNRRVNNVVEETKINHIVSIKDEDLYDATCISNAILAATETLEKKFSKSR